MGGGSAEIKALYEITPLLGISKFLGGNCEVRYARGYDIPAKKESDHNWQEDSLMQAKRRLRQQRKPRTVHVCGKKLWNWQKNISMSFMWVV